MPAQVVLRYETPKDYVEREIEDGDEINLSGLDFSIIWNNTEKVSLRIRKPFDDVDAFGDMLASTKKAVHLKVISDEQVLLGERTQKLEEMALRHNKALRRKYNHA